MTEDELVGKLAAVVQSRDGLRFVALFGSVRTRGLAGARDVDVGVLRAPGVSAAELDEVALAMSSATGREIDLVDLHIDAASTFLRWEVARTGRFVAGELDAWRDFQVRAHFDWVDLEPYFEREAAGLRRVLAR